MDVVADYVVQLFQGFLAWWRQGYVDILAMTWPKFFGVMWWLIIFDFPRYILPDIIMFFWMLLRLLFKWPKQPVMDRDFEPTVSVLVPAHNEGEHAAKTVRSLLEQDYPIHEIIVVDDGSRDDTYETVRPFTKHPNVRVIRNAVRGGKASALQTGFAASTGEIIVSCDSDSTFDRGSVRWLVQYLRDPEVGAVSGNF